MAEVFPAIERPSPRAASRPATLHKEVAGLLALLGVVAMLTLSDSCLYWFGVNYTAPGGGLVGKLHPGSYLLLLAFLAATLPVNPARYIRALGSTHPAIPIYALVVIGVMLYCTLRFGVSGAAFINETLFVPAILAMTLFALPLAWRRRIFLAALALVALDSAIGLAEFATRQRLIPYFISGQLHVEPQFRATALLGHPLKNATIVATFLCLLPVLEHHRVAAALAGLTMGFSLLAFGSRLAFGLCGLIAALALVRWYVTGVLRRRFSYLVLTGATFLVLALALVGALAVAFLGQGSRIFQTLSWDPSAQSRTLVLRAFDHVSGDQLLFGVGPDGIGQILDYLKSYTILTDIENFWVLLMLNFGLLAFLLFVLALAGMLATMLRGASAPVKIASLVFVVMTSSNNSLAVKDSSLSLLIAGVMGAAAYARLADPRYRPSAASAPGSNTRLGFARSRGTTAPSARYSTSSTPVATPNRSA